MTWLLFVGDMEAEKPVVVQFPVATVVQLLIPFMMLLATVLLLFDELVVPLSIWRPFTLMPLTLPLLLPLTVMVPGLPLPLKTVMVVVGEVASLTLLNTVLPGVEPTPLLHSW